MFVRWKPRDLSWIELAKRVWVEAQRNDVFGNAAKLAYYLLLALFPLLIFLTSIIGIIIGSGSGMRHVLFNYLARVMPSGAFQLINQTMLEVSTASGAGKLSFGFLATLWAASSGMGAINDALNAAYNVEETRPWWRRRLTAIGLTIALAVLIIIALSIVLVGSKIADHLTSMYVIGRASAVAWQIIQWPIALAFMLLAFALIYFFAPNLRDQKWTWITPGSIAGVVLWLAVSFAFKGYLHFFDSYSRTYGSLGAVIVLMLWLYLTGLAVLIGGEINSEVENASSIHPLPTGQGNGPSRPLSS